MRYLVLCALAAGCSSSETAAPSTSSTPPVDAGTTAPAEPAAPATAALPCLAGWHEVPGVAGGPATCDPWPAGGPASCAVDEAHFPGEPGCRRVGAACPAGEWADAPATGSVLYVRAGGAAGGDGSQALPFATIDEAIAAATSSTTILLGKGKHVGGLVVQKPSITFRGACVLETEIAKTTDTTATVQVGDSDVHLENVRVSGAHGGVLALFGGTDLTLDGVVVEKAAIAGLSVQDGAHVTATDLVVRDSTSRGIEIADAEVDLDGAVVDGVKEVGILAFPKAVLSAQRLAVLAVAKPSTSKAAVGVVAVDADATLVGAAIEGVQGNGLYAEGARVKLEDAVVRRSDFGKDGLGAGVLCDEQATLDVARVTFDANAQAGIGALNGSTVHLVDSVVSGTLEGGALALDSSVLTAERVFAHDNAGIALMALGATTSMILSDLTVLATRETQGIGGGLFGVFGAHVEIDRAVFEANPYFGIAIGDPGTTAALRDVVVRGTLSAGGGVAGRGLDLENGGVVTLERARFEQNRECNVFVSGLGTSLTGTDVVVADTLPRSCVELGTCQNGGGVGVGAYDEGAIVLTSFSVSTSALAGIQLARLGRIELTLGKVFDQPIGANVQDAAPEAVLLEHDVDWDNDRNLDAEQLPTLDPASPVPPQ